MSTRLVFQQPVYTGGPVRLVFGAAELLEPLPATVDVAVEFGGFAVSAVALYDNRNPLRVSTSAASGWQRAQGASAEPPAGWGKSASASGEPGNHWQQAAGASGEPAAPWGNTSQTANDPATRWQDGEPAARQAGIRQQSGLQRDGDRRAAWQQAAPAHVVAIAPHQQGVFVVHQFAPRVAVARPATTLFLAPHQQAMHALAELLVPWQQARPVPPGVDPVDPPPQPPQREIDLRLLFSCPAYVQGQPVRLVFGRICGDEQSPALVVVPQRSVYMIVNSASLRRVDNNQSLPTYATTLTLDAESWTWSFSADMPMDAVPLIQRSSPSVLVEVELTMNGLPFRAMIESVSRNRTFDDWRITVKGRGLGATLDTPYAFERQHYSASARNAQQLAADALTINGVSLGWDLDWQIADWLVPADTWSMQGSPIAAVNRIAAAAGGYVQPHPTDMTLRVLPKYPLAPWDWASMTPDIELPTGPVSTESVEWVDGYAYNRVFVSGTTAGIVAQVTRTGTAGDILAPMVTDSLITAAAVAGPRGMSELARCGRWANLTLRLPLLSETGVIVPGKTLLYNDGDTSHTGIVRSVSVQDDGDEIWQSIGVASYVA